MKTKIITCITCPVGCEMTIEFEEKSLISLSGHKCKKGEDYAFDEITDPRRVLTSTVVLNGAKIKLMPVKTDKPIKKEKIFEAMKKINKIKLDASAKAKKIKMGDILYSDFTENGINLIAGRDI